MTNLTILPRITIKTIQTRAATIMRRIIPHNSAESQLNLSPHNSPHNWTKLTRDAAYFREMEMRYYNTWLFSEVATRCLHQITSDTATIDRKRAKFAQNFQFSFDITIHHFDFIRSDSTDSELEIVNPSPVRAHTNSSVAQKNQGKKKARSFVFRRRRRYLDFIGQSGYRKQLAPSPVERRWTSYFECMTYHAELLNVEKAFLASEAMDIVDSDTLEDLREFLSSNFKSILLECKIINERVKPLITVLEIFESNLGITSLM